ncbi:MAG TPA: hypothetical protein VFM05_08315 [Candidatus Saccharimonadales bacterium]|nr:hypothetical protein [Candidatus Saccharimonadales bacterium]
MSYGLHLSGGEALAEVGVYTELTGHPIDDDRLMTLAYIVARGVVNRHANGDPDAQDVPIGAVAYDPTTGCAYTAYPRDRELGERGAHAEPLALRMAVQGGARPENLQVATTFEPCPGCLEHMADRGVSTIVFGIGRTPLEQRGLVKRHTQSALDIAASGREGLPYPELRQIGNVALRVACLAVFDPFRRDPISERVTFRGGHDHLPDFTADILSANGNLGVVLTEAQLSLVRCFGGTSTAYKS